MCGIIGYVGHREAGPILMEGLKCLEYRGYDSAGLSVLSPELSLVTRKQPGRIRDLERDLNGQVPAGSCGIAHTRWATHGAPSEANAHPHLSPANDIALVHNGIIENALAHRPRLEELGYEFRSETDTEVLVHLVDLAFRSTDLLEEAVAAALAHVEGTYGIAVVSARDPGKLVAGGNGSPILLGIGRDNEFIVASDALAIVAHTKRVVRLCDGDLAVMGPSGYGTFDVTGQQVSRQMDEVSWDVRDTSKGSFSHYMQKEIFEQPSTLEGTMRGRLLEDEGSSKLGGISVSDKELQELDRIVITACGTSWHAGLLGAYMLEDFARVPVVAEYASEFRYRNPVLSPRTLVVGLSQSGETADTVAAIREAKHRGCPTMGIVNRVGSRLASLTDFGVYLHAGPEIGVASTKSFTSQIVALALFTLYLARRRSISILQGRDLVHALSQLPELARATLAVESQMEEVARRYCDAPNCLYLGRGYQFPVALEGALKLKEVSYIHAEGYPAAEMKHGPIALIDRGMPVVVLAPKDSVYNKTLANIQEIKARQGRVIAVVTAPDREIADLADEIVIVPQTIPSLMPILSVIPLQLLAYHMALMRGCNVDQPRNLAKSVTVE